jgi:ABC-type nickel/cobalt efflux system permease component RcnA
MTSFLFLGFLLGLRHALEADHLAAVATLAARQRGVGRTLLQGAAWGVGHGSMLLAVGGVCLLFRLAIPDRAARLLEAGVGVMLVVLGIGVLRRLVERRVHVHVHRHEDGTVHLHAHRHAPAEAHDPARHAQAHSPETASTVVSEQEHGHVHRDGRFRLDLPWRAVGIGMVHGLAGSAALLLLVAASLGSPATGLVYIACFSVGAVIGMAALSAVIALPLRRPSAAGDTAGPLGRAATSIEALVGLTALGIGSWVIYTANWRS